MKRHGGPDRTRAEIAIVSPFASAEAPRGRTESFDRAYWTRHCVGYHVQFPQGRLGFVEEVREQHDGVPIAVCAGLLGQRLLVFPADNIAFIVPSARAIYLRSSAQLVAAEPGSAADPRVPGVSS
jgi:hypothetical protein